MELGELIGRTVGNDNCPAMNTSMEMKMFQCVQSLIMRPGRKASFKILMARKSLIVNQNKLITKLHSFQEASYSIFGGCQTLSIFTEAQNTDTLMHFYSSKAVRHGTDRNCIISYTVELPNKGHA